MTPNETRTIRQIFIIDEWIRGGCKGTVVACTRFGKTHCIMLAIKKCLERDSNRKVIIVVPSIPLKQQFDERLIREGYESNVKVKVVNTAASEDDECDLLIVDEIHRMAAEFFSQIFTRIKYRWILGCTATLERQDGKHTVLEALAPVFHTVTLKEALAKGWVSEFDIYNLGIALARDEQAEYQRLHELHNTSFAVFGWDFNLAFSCMGPKKIYDLSRRNQYDARYVGPIQYQDDKAFFKLNVPLMTADRLGGDWDQSRVIATAMNWRMAMQKRNELVYEANGKLVATLDIIRSTPESVLTFSKSTAFADKITELSPRPAVSYHSKIKKPQRNTNMQEFIDGRYQVMNVVDAVNEGIDFPGVNVGIIEATTQVNRTAIQRVGRLLMQGGRSKIIWLYVKGSVEFGRVNKCQIGIPNKRWVESVEQIFQ